MKKPQIINIMAISKKGTVETLLTNSDLSSLVATHSDGTILDLSGVIHGTPDAPPPKENEPPKSQYKTLREYIYQSMEIGTGYTPGDIRSLPDFPRKFEKEKVVSTLRNMTTAGDLVSENKAYWIAE
jgi:hypothetical protein